MNILITGVGGPTPRSFGISLKKYSRFKDCKLIGTDINPLSIGLYDTALFEATYVVPPANEPEQYWSAITDLVEKHQIDFAIILPELEVLEWSKKKQHGAWPCPTFIPDLAFSEVLINKAKMTEVLNDDTLVPKSVWFHREEVQYDTIKQKLGPVFWVRSTSGTSGLGSLKVEGEKALLNWISINPNVENFIASEFLNGRNLACKMLYNNGKLIRTGIAERVQYIMSKVAPSGITGNTSYGRLLNDTLPVAQAVKAIEAIAASTGVAPHGFFTADFKENEDGLPLITEINVRHVAFTQCFAAAGANFAADTLELLTENPDFDLSYQHYQFEEGQIFLRDVDHLPILMNEQDLLKK